MSREDELVLAVLGHMKNETARNSLAYGKDITEDELMSMALNQARAIAKRERIDEAIQAHKSASGFYANETVMDYIKRMDGIVTKTDLVKRFRKCKSRDLNAQIGELIKTGKIDIEIKKMSGSGRPSVIIRLVEQTND